MEATTIGIALGMIGGVIIGAFLMFLVYRWQRPNYQLSYTFAYIPYVTSKDSDYLGSHVQISIGDATARTIQSCTITFRNTGNQILEGLQILINTQKGGMLIAPKIESYTNAQVGKRTLTEVENENPAFLCDLGHLLTGDRFRIQFLAANVELDEIDISINKPPVHFGNVKNLDSPFEQIRDAFQSDPAKFSLQVLVPILVVLAGGATIFIMDLLRDSK